LVLAGYVAGSSYRRVADVAGPAGLVLLGGLVVVGGSSLGVRWIARHPDEVRGASARVLGRPRVAAITRRYRSQLRFLSDRFRPGSAVGLALTVQLAVLVAAGWAFGVLVQDVVIGRDAARIDLPVLRYLVDHRTPWLTTVLRVVTALGSSAVLGPVMCALAAFAYHRTRRWRSVAQLGLPLVGSIVLYDIVKPLVGRPRPHVGHLVSTATGFAFPSGHATQTTAVAFTLAFVAAGRTPSWPRKVGVWAAAAAASLTIGFSRVYLGVHWPTDVLGGFALGALWAAMCAMAFGTSHLPADAERGTAQPPAATRT
jgi:undecaprenyl-diphosphatase